jgi:hypothetical protein
MSEIKLFDRNGNLITSQKMQLPCNALLLEAEYRRRLKPRIQFGAGGGAGYYQLGEEVESPATGQDFEGNSFGGQAFAIGEWEFTPAASIGLDIGYRWAKVGVDKVNREPPFNEIDMGLLGAQHADRAALPAPAHEIRRSHGALQPAWTSTTSIRS